MSVDQPARWLPVAAAVVVLVFVGFGVTMWSAGLFDFSGTDASAKIVAAALVLVGGLIGTLATIMGLLLKHSLDLRNADLRDQAQRRLEIDAERNNDLRIESEKRLNLEVAIQAVKLLSTTAGHPVPEVQRAGAIFALAGLGRYELATVLTGQMLAEGLLGANSAAWILNRALKSGSIAVQEEAVSILYLDAKKFLLPDGAAAFPDCMLNWSMKLPDSVREAGASALGRLLVARSPSEWNMAHARTLLHALILGWETETNEENKIIIGTVLQTLLPAFPSVQSFSGSKLDLEKIRSEVAAAKKGVLLEELQVELETWLSSCSTADSRSREDLEGTTPDSNPRGQ